MFKEVFKQFKLKKTTTDSSIVYNFQNEKSLVDKIRPYQTDAFLNKLKIEKLSQYGLLPPELWKLYEIKDKPGLIYIKNPFTTLGQRYWISRSLRDYSKKPQKSNLDAHNELDQHENWWEICQTDSNRSSKLMKKLRWVTLGYHHDWDTKIYSEESKDPFPNDLAQLCQYFASVLGFSKYSAEAAIVNYYHMDSTLSGHTDHSEPNLTAPLFSLSFGQTAVFLIGGLTKDEKPLALFVNSGDVIVMSKESRQCYHAVPCILKASSTPWNNLSNTENKDNFLDNITDKNLIEHCRNDEFWAPFQQYINSSRININVRQVLNIGQDKL